MAIRVGHPIVRHANRHRSVRPLDMGLLTSMSTHPVPPPRRRRRPEDVQAEALRAARAILLESGPQAVTLKAVGRALGMTHANLIHHFGSAGALQAALMASMIEDLSGTLDGVVEQLRTGELPLFGLLSRVFDIYEAGGGGRLTAWLALERVTDGLEPIGESLRGLVAELCAQAGREQAPDGPIGQAVLLAAFVAVADALTGEQVEAMLGFQRGAGRQIAARALANIIWGSPDGPTGTPP